jgi:hypothetical protein
VASLDLGLVGVSQMAKIEMRLGENRQCVVLTIPVQIAGREHKLPVALNSATVDAVLRGLAVYRAQMPDQPPMRLQPVMKDTPINDPPWSHGRPFLADQSIVSFRHPGYGWLHFALNLQEAAKLGRALLATSGPTTIRSPVH